MQKDSIEEKPNEAIEYKKFHSTAWKYFLISILAGCAIPFFSFTEGFIFIGVPFVVIYIIFMALSITNFVLYFVKAKTMKNISIFALIGIVLVLIEISFTVLVVTGGINRILMIFK